MHQEHGKLQKKFIRNHDRESALVTASVDGKIIFNCTLKKQRVRVLTGFILRTDCIGRKCATSFYPVVAVVSHNVYSQMNGASSNLYFMLKNVSKEQCTMT